MLQQQVRVPPAAQCEGPGRSGYCLKVAGGMMNTHSSNGDFRMEVFGCYAGLFGGSRIVSEILSSVTTENVIDILRRERMEKQVIQKITERALYYINRRVGNNIKTKLIIYSNNHGILN